MVDRTGSAVGGVPPVGHTTPPVTFIDRDLQRYQTIWAAGGSPNAVFALTPADLARVTFRVQERRLETWRAAMLLKLDTDL